MPNQFSVYKLVTDTILEQLERGVVPWRKPWRFDGTHKSIDGHSYRGVNVFLLEAQGYGSNIWMSYRQAKKHGGTVHAGAKGTQVIFIPKTANKISRRYWRI